MSLLAAILALLLPLAGGAQPGGDIQVTCGPGLRVYLDETFVGLSSVTEDGKYIAGVSVGRHTVRVERQGFHPLTKTVNVTSGRAVEIKIGQLQPEVRAAPGGQTETDALQPIVGSVLIRCVPIRCSFEFLEKTYQNGQTATHQTLSGVPEGTYPIVFRRSSDSLRGTVTIVRGQTREISADFLGKRIVDVTAEAEAERQRTEHILNQEVLRVEVDPGECGLYRYMLVRKTSGEPILLFDSGSKRHPSRDPVRLSLPARDVPLGTHEFDFLFWPQFSFLGGASAHCDTSASSNFASEFTVTVQAGHVTVVRGFVKETKITWSTE